MGSFSEEMGQFISKSRSRSKTCYIKWYSRVYRNDNIGGGLFTEKTVSIMLRKEGVYAQQGLYFVKLWSDLTDQKLSCSTIDI